MTTTREYLSGLIGVIWGASLLYVFGLWAVALYAALLFVAAIRSDSREHRGAP